MVAVKWRWVSDCEIYLSTADTIPVNIFPDNDNKAISFPDDD